MDGVGQAKQTISDYSVNELKEALVTFGKMIVNAMWQASDDGEN